MKKILCVLMAVLAIGCFAGCVDHNDDVCDKCDSKILVTQNEKGDKELCAECWAKEVGDALDDAING